MYETYKITDAAGVLAHRAVVQATAAGEVSLPGGANAGKFVGLTQEAQAAQNGPVRVKTGGRAFAVAGAAIAAGDYVNIGGVTGKVASCQTAAVAAPGTAALTYVIGIARTGAGADGDVIEIEIRPFLAKTAAS